VLPAPPRDPSNRLADDRRAAKLGQRLFFDKSFSGRLLEGDNDGSAKTLGMKGETGKVACVGCHVPQAGFLDDRTLGKQISLAASWVLRRTPSLLDVGQARLLMWDGRRDAFHNQVFGPIESTNEMNSSRLFVAQQIAARYAADYEALFGPLPPLGDANRFPRLDAAHTGCDRLAGKGTPPSCHGMPGDRAEYDGMRSADQDAVTRVVANAGRALGAYARLLTCGQGRFDRWVAGDATALSHSEQRGAALFIGKGRCLGCHTGPFFTDQQFHNVGLAPATVAVVFSDRGDRGAAQGLAAALIDPLNVRGKYSDGDDGRLPSEVSSAMEGAFRTPSLRCVMRRPSLMHTGQLRTVDEAIAFFDRGGHPAGYPGKNELVPLGLSDRERTDLAAFLQTLEGPGPTRALIAAP
jgi:cytochrome c peroxidase